MCNTPQTTLVLPPEVKLIDKLADKAVHDCDFSRGRTLRVRILTFSTAKANPNIDLGWSALQWSARVKHIFYAAHRVEKLRCSSGWWPMAVNWASSSFILNYVIWYKILDGLSDYIDAP